MIYLTMQLCFPDGWKSIEGSDIIFGDLNDFVLTADL